MSQEIKLTKTKGGWSYEISGDDAQQQALAKEGIKLLKDIISYLETLEKEGIG